MDVDRREGDGGWYGKFDELASTLRSEGWVVEVTCYAVPVQLEGRLPTGEIFYFRSRWDEACLDVWTPDRAEQAAQLSNPSWRRCLTRPDWQWASAGTIGAEEAGEILAELRDLYAAEA